MALDSRTVIDRFHLTVPNLRLQNLDAPRINVETVQSVAKWTPVLIWQLTVAEMVMMGVAGQTACFNIVLDENGLPANVVELRAAGLSVRYGYDTFTETAQFEKVWPEPQTNFAMGMGGRYWCQIDGLGGNTDRVYGVTLRNPADVDDPNGHHATVIVWQFQKAIGVPITEPDKPASGYTLVKLQKINEQLIAIDAQIAALTLARREIAGWLEK